MGQAIYPSANQRVNADMDFEILLESPTVKLDLADAEIRELPPRGIRIEGKPRVPEQWDSVIEGACYAIEIRDSNSTMRNIFRVTKRSWLPSGLVAVEIQREDWMDNPAEAKKRLPKELEKFKVE